MSDLRIRRTDENDEFFIALNYDSTHYQLPIPFHGYRLYLNDDSAALIILEIKGKKKWGEKVDLLKLLGPGTYKLTLKTGIWVDRSNYTEAAFLLKAGDYTDVRVYRKKPDFPFPISQSDEHEYDHSDSGVIGFEEYVDTWTITIYDANE